MKKLGLLFFIFTISISFTGCSSQVTVDESEPGIPVQTIKVTEETYPETLKYVGMVSAENLKKYSFKTAGKIESIYIEEGEKVNKGDKLVGLDTKDLEYAVQAAQAQLSAAQAQYDKAIKGTPTEEITQAELSVNKAEEAYNHAKDTYERLQKLFDEGSISKNELDKAKLEMNIREDDLNIAKQMEIKAKKGADKETKQQLLAQVEQAKTNYEQKKDMLNHAIITSDVNGHVAKILNQESENVAAGYPVIVVRSDDNIVTTGVIEEDLDKIKKDQQVLIYTKDREIKGSVSAINKFPDSVTRTYNVDINLPENNLNIGAIVDITFIIKENKGILIPIIGVINNGNDNIVYVVEDNKAVKKRVSITKTLDTRVVINGLQPGEYLIIEGNTKVTDGETVIINKS